jgi:predicted phosphodiesterase
MEKTSKEIIHQIVEEASAGITLETLPGLEEEFFSAIGRVIEGAEKKVFVEVRDVDEAGAEGEGALLPQRTQITTQRAQRIIVVGDIHCDFAALKAMLLKILDAPDGYDYFADGQWIFLGDYIDRGASPFQTLRLLLKLKEFLGPRCIMLRGNHDNFYYNEEAKRFMSPVSPSDTVDFFTEYLSEKTIGAFKSLWDVLPWFVIVSRKEKKIILTHGSVPRDDLAAAFSLDAFRELPLPLETDSREKVMLRRCLNSMTWGDPVLADMKYNSGMTRFEFGSQQFDAFMKAQGFSHLVRGHEPVSNGFEQMYGGRLTTLFSSGGSGNEDSYYADLVPNPAFAIIDENGELRGESVFEPWMPPANDETAIETLNTHEP